MSSLVYHGSSDTGKVKQICVLFTEGEHVNDIRLAWSFPRVREFSADHQWARFSLLRRLGLSDIHPSRGDTQGKLSLRYFDRVQGYIPRSMPCELAKDKGTRHEINLKPGSKYCIMMQWSLSHEKVLAIDKLFVSRLAAGHMMESTSSYSSPNFWVRKAIGRWRTVHGCNKLNAATVPDQTPIPRKDVYHRWYSKDYHLFINGSDGWLPSDPYVWMGHLKYSSKLSNRYSLGVAGDATRMKRCPCYIEQMCDQSVKICTRFCTHLLQWCVRP